MMPNHLLSKSPEHEETYEIGIQKYKNNETALREDKLKVSKFQIFNTARQLAILIQIVIACSTATS